MYSQRIRTTLFSVGITLWISGGLYAQSPLGTGFAYQGQLEENGAPLSGPVDFRFSLHNALTAAEGQQVGSSIVISDYQVSGGVFAVELDFGVAAFNGQARYLQIEVRSPHDQTDTEPYTTLEPRLPISATPYALQTRGIFVDEAGQVSIGVTPTPATAQAQGPGQGQGQLHAEAAPGQLLAILGSNASTAQDAVGIRGTTASALGRGMEGIGPGEGVRGVATGSGGAGVRGQGGGEGVRGEATEHGGTGVKGTTASDQGRGVEGSGLGEGVLGHASGPSGVTTGVRGMSDSPDGTGVKGQGGAQGVHGVATEAGGTGMKGEGGAAGVHGEATAAGGTGVKGTTASPDGRGMEGSGPREGILGHATATSGAADGVHGLTDSVAGRGVFGEATSDGTGVMGQAGGVGTGVMGQAGGSGTGVNGKTVSGAGVWGEITGTSGDGVRGLAYAISGVTNGVVGQSNSPTGHGVIGFAPNEGVRGELTSGPGSAFGVLGRALGTNATGVYGETAGSSPDGYGVHGRSFHDDHRSAGVLAEGSGTNGVTILGAAALEIRDGAIRVSGGARPAGTIVIPGGWGPIQSCENSGGPPAHAHTIGYRVKVFLFNDLIVDDSIILATVELKQSEPGDPSFAVHVKEKQAGQAVLSITLLGQQGALCLPPSETNVRSVHYLIINPEPVTP